jgi:hypothetical protein
MTIIKYTSLINTIIMSNFRSEEKYETTKHIVILGGALVNELTDWVTSHTLTLLESKLKKKRLIGVVDIIDEENTKKMITGTYNFINKFIHKIYVNDFFDNFNYNFLIILFIISLTISLITSFSISLMILLTILLMI